MCGHQGRRPQGLEPGLLLSDLDLSSVPAPSAVLLQQRALPQQPAGFLSSFLPAVFSVCHGAKLRGPSFPLDALLIL